MKHPELPCPLRRSPISSHTLGNAWRASMCVCRATVDSKAVIYVNIHFSFLVWGRTISLTAAWCRDLSKLTVAVLVNKFSLGLLNQINRNHTIPPCFLKIYFRVFHRRLCLPKRLLPFIFSDWTSVRHLTFPHSCYVSHLSHHLGSSHHFVFSHSFNRHSSIRAGRPSLAPR
jgi:hypothetical protein